MRARAALPIALAAVLSAAAFASTARADGHDDAEADAAIRRGVELRRHAKDQDALEEFRKAYALVKSARALAQIGLAEQALGRWVDAENDLAEAMSSKTDPWIRKNMATLSGAVDVIRKHLGSLDVIGPAGAELLIDGRVSGKLPLAKPARVPIGSLTIEVKKDGFFPATRPVSIAAGELTRESVDLQPIPAAPVARKPEILDGGNGPGGGLQRIAGGGGGGEQHPPPPDERPPDHAGGGWSRTLAWIFAGGAVIGTGVGVAELLILRSKEADFTNDKCTVDPNGLLNSSQCANLLTSRDQAKVGAIVGFSAAGALAITSAVLFLTSSSSSSPSAALRWAPHAGTMFACAPSFLTPGAACQLRF